MRNPFQSIVLAIALFVFLLICGGTARAQDHSSHSHDNGAIHFSHPLVSESPSPDTKVRFDYVFANLHGEEDEMGAIRHTLLFEAEYAFAPWLSLEVDVPYTFLVPDEGTSTNRLDNMEVGLKYANFTFAEHGLLLGGGIEFGLPTGNEEKGIGSNHVLEVEPFVDFGFQRNHWEIVGFTSFGFPVNENDGHGADLEVGWNLSVLFHLTPRIETLLEFNGENVFGGEEDGHTVVNVTPGFKLQPIDDSNFQVGIGVSLPLTDDFEFHTMPMLSVFYHF